MPATLAQLLALIPPGAKYNEVSFALQNINEFFPEDLRKVDAARIAGWVAEITAGTRTDKSVRSDIFEFVVGESKIIQRFGTDAATAQALIAGTKQFSAMAGTGVVDADQPSTSVVAVGGTKISQGGRLLKVKNPAGSDAPELFYVVYKWRGVDMAFEVGNKARLVELFGSAEAFDDMATVTQAGFETGGYVEAGMIDQEIGATESFTSRTEREVRALGLEDLPEWLGNAPDALALVAEATAQEWSSGRLWTELAKTQAFTDRFGKVIDKYLTGNVTVGDAVAQLVADENQMRAAIRPFDGSNRADTAVLQDLINEGWTAGAAAQVLEAGESLRRRPETLAYSNLILQAAGLPVLDEAGYINALRGHGPQEVIETLNTAAAAQALELSGIGLDDEDIPLIMELVTTSDRLLTPESYTELAQQLSFNMIRYSTEVERGKLGIAEEDLISAAFGRESPTGMSSGKTLGLLARFERDRRAASEGFEGGGGFLDDQGRLRIPGLGGV